MRTKLLSGLAALALMSVSGTAMANEDNGIELHGFGDISLKTDYVTPRGLVVTTGGAAVQVLNGLVLTTPLANFHAGTWVDINPGFSRKDGNITAVNEFDWFFGVDKDVVKGLNLGVEFSQFVSGQPSVAFKRESNIEFTAKYSENPGGTFSINPYAKLFWAFNSKSSTVVLGKAGNTFDVELGVVPTYKLKGITFSAPTWFTVGPKSYWGRNVSAQTRPDGNIGVFSTGLKGAVPLTFLGPAGAKASLYGFVQYYNLVNDNLVRAKMALNSGASNRDHFVFGTGISFGF